MFIKQQIIILKEHLEGELELFMLFFCVYNGENIVYKTQECHAHKIIT